VNPEAADAAVYGPNLQRSGLAFEVTAHHGTRHSDASGDGGQGFAVADVAAFEKMGAKQGLDHGVAGTVVGGKRDWPVRSGSVRCVSEDTLPRWTG
jgi:hypothetical protein